MAVTMETTTQWPALGKRIVASRRARSHRRGLLVAISGIDGAGKGLRHPRRGRGPSARRAPGRRHRRRRRAQEIHLREDDPVSAADLVVTNDPSAPPAVRSRRAGSRPDPTPFHLRLSRRIAPGSFPARSPSVSRPVH